MTGVISNWPISRPKRPTIQMKAYGRVVYWFVATSPTAISPSLPPGVPAGTSLETLVAVEGHRWAIEDSFETAKNEFGLDHNESRSWHGWHRHVSLVMLAFAMMAVIRHRTNSPPPKKTKRRTTAKLKISPIRH
jgi:SRSO17 transposase